MAAAAPPRPQRRRTFGMDLNTDLQPPAPGSPSPPISPSPSTPSDASCCGAQVVVRAGSAASDNANLLAQQQVSRSYQKPRGSRPQVATAADVKTAYHSVVSPITGPTKPPPMAPLPPLPGSAGINSEPQPKEPPRKLMIPSVYVVEKQTPSSEDDTSPNSDLTSPMSPESAEIMYGQQGVRRAHRVQLQKRKAPPLTIRMQQVQDEEQKEKRVPPVNTALERRPSMPLLTPHSDYRLSPPASPRDSPTREHPPPLPPLPPLPAQKAAESVSPASSTTISLSSATSERSAGKASVVGFEPLPVVANDTEVLADVKRTSLQGNDIVSTQARSHSPWHSVGRSWDDATYFISPLERIQAVQLDANGPASLPTTPDANHLHFTPDAPRGFTAMEERRNLAVLLPEAGTTLVSANNTPTEDHRIDRRQGLGFKRFSLVSPAPEELSAGADSFSHQSFGCHLDDAERMQSMADDPGRQNHTPIVSSPLAAMGSQIITGPRPTVTRLQRTGANHPFLVDAQDRPQSHAVRTSRMKSLPTTPIDVAVPLAISTAATRKTAVRSSLTPSATASEGTFSQRLRFSRSLASVFRRAQDDQEHFSFAEHEVPKMPKMPTPTRSNTMGSTRKTPRSKPLDPDEPIEDLDFSVSRPTSRRRMFEAARCTVRDQDGNVVRVGDLFPRWPDADGSVEPFRRDSGYTAHSFAPLGTEGPPPRTILFFLRNFWCGMCQDYTLMSISRLEPAVLAANNIRVAIIGCGDYKMIKAYKKLFKLKFDCYTDGSRRLYELMGMVKEAAFVQPMRNRAAYNRPYVKQVFAGVKNGMSHMGGPLADPGHWRQLGGEFIIAPGYKCEFAHRMTNMANHMEALEVLARAGVDVTGQVPLRDDHAAWEALDLAGSNSCAMSNVPWLDNEEVMNESTENFQPPAKQHWLPPSSTAARESGIRDSEYMSPPPDLVPSESESSSEGAFRDSLTGTPDDLDPIEAHRRIYAAFVHDDPAKTKPRTSVGSIVTVDAEGKRVSGRKAVVLPAA